MAHVNQEQHPTTHRIATLAGTASLMTVLGAGTFLWLRSVAPHGLSDLHIDHWFDFLKSDPTNAVPVPTEVPPSATGADVPAMPGEHVPPGYLDMTQVHGAVASPTHPDKVYVHAPGGNWYVYDRLMSGTQPTAYFDAQHPTKVLECDLPKDIHPVCTGTAPVIEKPAPVEHPKPAPVEHKPVPKPAKAVVVPPPVVEAPIPVPEPTPVPPPAPVEPPHEAVDVCIDPESVPVEEWGQEVMPSKEGIIIDHVRYPEVRVIHAPQGMTEERALEKLRQWVETHDPKGRGGYLLFTDADCDGHPERIQCVSLYEDRDGQVHMRDLVFLGNPGHTVGPSGGGDSDYDRMTPYKQKKVLAN